MEAVPKPQPRGCEQCGDLGFTGVDSDLGIEIMEYGVPCCCEAGVYFAGKQEEWRKPMPPEHTATAMVEQAMREAEKRVTR